MRRLILLCLLTSPALAVPPPPSPEPPDLQALERLPQVPEPPLPVQSGEEMDTEVVIVRRGDKKIQEYRRGGHLYMIKVVPDMGPPYYFLDVDGDGQFDIRSGELDQAYRVNMWRLLEW